MILTFFSYMPDEILMSDENLLVMEILKRRNYFKDVHLYNFYKCEYIMYVCMFVTLSSNSLIFHNVPHKS